MVYYLRSCEVDCWQPELQLKVEEDKGTASRSRGLSTRGRGSYDGDNPPVFTLVDRGSDDRYVVPAKSAEESTIRLLFADHDEESLTVYTDGFRAYDPLEEDDALTRKYVVHGEGEYAAGDIHVNTCESRVSLRDGGFAPSGSVKRQANAVSQSLSAPLRTLQKTR